MRPKAKQAIKEKIGMKFTRIALAAALLGTSGAAAAQSATDAGCILVSNAFAKNSKDANAQKAAEASLYFYLGRIPDGTSSAHLKTLFDAQAKTITETNAGPTMNKCVQAIQSKFQLLQSLSGNAPAAPPQKKPEGR
jgi:hypothetical protein